MYLYFMRENRKEKSLGEIKETRGGEMKRSRIT